MANPRHVVTTQTKTIVAAMSLLGRTQKEICEYMGIANTKTLRKYYKVELQNKSDQRIIDTERVRASLLEKALKGDTIACIFWLKAQAKWYDVPTDNEQEVHKEFNKIQIEVLQGKEKTKKRPTERSKSEQEEVKH